MRIVSTGWRYAGLAVILALPAMLLSPLLSLLFVGLAGFSLWFFRDPDRTPEGPGVVAPADGRISVIRSEDGQLRVGIFMNITDVHVNRAPLEGNITAIEHSPGGHLPAFTKSSDRNERIRTEFDEFTVIQIAGTIARRISSYLDVGDQLRRGDRIGHIAFGSRCDVLLPAEYQRADLCVTKREHVLAGQTIIARRKDE